MKYVSIDIETTGLDPENDQVLSIGAIIEDTNNPLKFEDIPKFHGVIKRNSIKGGLYAINLNRDLLETLNQYMTAKDQDEKNDIVQMTGMQFYEEDEIVEEFYYWLVSNDLVDLSKVIGHGYVTTFTGKMVPAITRNTRPIQINTAGKNFATFDKLFLERLPRWKQLIKVRQRIIDPSVLYVDWANDESLPSMSECKVRAGLDGHVSHNALEDAWDVVMLIRASKQKST
jgi:DNA polymerase III epsilon subunit-like protein